CATRTIRPACCRSTIAAIICTRATRATARWATRSISRFSNKESHMTNDALRTILPVAGWDDKRARDVEITGAADPILPTPFRIGETSAAALAAVGLAVSDLWDLRTGRRQEIALDTRQA